MRYTSKNQRVWEELGASSLPLPTKLVAWHRLHLPLYVVLDSTLLGNYSELISLPRLLLQLSEGPAVTSLPSRGCAGNLLLLFILTIPLNSLFMK